MSTELLALLSNPAFWAILVVYFLPTMIAVHRRSIGAATCFWCNLVFGWTILGWFIAAVLAFLPTHEEMASRKAS